MAIKKLIFIQETLLEELEATKKGVVNKNGVLKLQNGINYKLEPAIIFNDEESGQGDIKKLKGTILTIEEVELKGYDLYGDSVIVDDLVYSIEQGFKGCYVQNSEVTPEPVEKTDQITTPKENGNEIVEDSTPNDQNLNFDNNKQTKKPSDEQLLINFMLGKK